jgi:phospholipase C
MTTLDRRNFLRLAGAGALAAALPTSIRRALAIPANNATGTINDVEHIVVLMQENRSFDHYFGSLRGVRGFGDPHAVFLPNGNSVWQQPPGNGNDFVLPFRPPARNLGLQFLEDLPHDWNTTHAAFNNGNYDRWVPAKGAASMAYMTRSDVPFHYALADAFTICDAYHCSLLGPTDPNRYYMWTGYVGNDGVGGGPVIDNAEAGYGWSTYPERLERAGISWKLYQDIGDGLDAGGYWGWTGDAYIGNYGDSSLLYFHQYQNTQPGDALYEKARTGTNIAAGGSLFEIFKADVANGTLPQVSWIIAPEAYSEHPNWPPNYGAWYVAQILDALTANPDVWSKTALFLTFDENDGFFDHMPPPFAPATSAQGHSTVATTNEFFVGDSTYVAGPYGLGPRVPMLVISPWTRGGFVNSQLFDHTSIIRFIEQRFGGANPDLIEANISPWRRSVCGDLTSAFDFANPNAAWPGLPDTGAYLPPDNLRHPDYAPQPPAHQSMPLQESGVRPARALPYAIDAAGRQDGSGDFAIDFSNSGAVGAVFHVRSGNRSDGPWVYTVESGKTLSASWNVLNASHGKYDFSVYGPNGFVRRYKGHLKSTPTAGRADPDASLHFDAASGTLKLLLSNNGDRPVSLSIVDGYGRPNAAYALAPGQSRQSDCDLSASFNWYDLIVSDERGDGFRRQFAGHIETGQSSISDPAIGAGPLGLLDEL